MQLQAVLHIPLSNYAYAVDEHTLTIRLRTARADVEKCTIFYGDRACPKNPIDVTEVPMEKVASDELFDYYEVTIQDQYKRVCYYFKIQDKEKEVFYSEYGFSDEMRCQRTQYFQFPYIRKEDIPDIPVWAKEIVMYHIFPDSFANGKREIKDKSGEIIRDGKTYKRVHGGTLKGITENVDYLRNLGVNCVYLNPIFAAESYHKYDTVNYFEIDPCFGTKEDLKELCDTLHENGIRIILDGVFNHCGSQFEGFLDVLKNGEKSKYKDWFYHLNFPVSYTTPPNYDAFAYVKEMPKLNTGNEEVIRYFCEVGTYWIREAGIDGWRLDVANEINHDFWRAFRRAVRQEKEDALLIGEIWEDSNIWLMGDQFDSTMNYTFMEICKEFFAEKSLTMTQFDEKVNRMLLRYPWEVTLVQMNFLDTHDVQRFLSRCEGDRKAFEAAVFFLMTCPGVPSVFYGDEKGIEGIKEFDYRAPMPWAREEKELETVFAEGISMRHEYEALQKGTYRTAWIDEDKKSYAFKRTSEDQELLVVLQVSGETEELEIPEEYQGRLWDGRTKEKICGSTFALESMEGKIFIIK